MCNYVCCVAYEISALAYKSLSPPMEENQNLFVIIMKCCIIDPSCRPIQCAPKKRPICFFCNIFYKTREIPMRFGTVSWINLLQNRVNIFHLTWIMSLHNLVKLEILITQVLPLHCQRKKLQNLSLPPQLWPPNSPDLNPVDYSVWGLLQENMYLSLIHIWRCRRSTLCRSRWSPYH